MGSSFNGDDIYLAGSVEPFFAEHWSTGLFFCNELKGKVQLIPNFHRTKRDNSSFLIPE
jgi:hypothetical protein